MMLCMNNNNELLESISLVPKLSMSLGETEMTLILVKTTNHLTVYSFHALVYRVHDLFEVS